MLEKISGETLDPATDKIHVKLIQPVLSPLLCCQNLSSYSLTKNRISALRLLAQIKIIYETTIAKIIHSA